MVINHNCKCPYFHADVNECNANNGGCEHTCDNVDGSFQCGCDTGYMLGADGLNCDGKYLYRLSYLDLGRSKTYKLKILPSLAVVGHNCSCSHLATWLLW